MSRWFHQLRAERTQLPREGAACAACAAVALPLPDALATLARVQGSNFSLAPLEEGLTVPQSRGRNVSCKFSRPFPVAHS